MSTTQQRLESAQPDIDREIRAKLCAMIQQYHEREEELPTTVHELIDQNFDECWSMIWRVLSDHAGDDYDDAVLAVWHTDILLELKLENIDLVVVA